MVKNTYSGNDWGMGSWGDNVPQNDEDIVKREIGKRFKMWGNTETYNLNKVLLGNIQRSNYFKSLSKLTTFKQLVDRIYYQVEYITPWEPNTNRKPSGGMAASVRGVASTGRPTRGFMLLAKLMTFHPTYKQVKILIDHQDSPYIRAIGFLFLRYCCAPENLWAWFSPYFDDKEPIRIHRDEKRDSTIGKMTRNLLEDLTFYDTHLYRIPVVLHRKMLSDMGDLGYDVKVAATTSSTTTRKRKGNILTSDTGPEKRLDPFDGMEYTRSEFFETYGGYDEWRRAKKTKKVQDKKRPKTIPAERRVDPADGNAYTKAEFILEYGGLEEWNNAAAPKRPPISPPPNSTTTASVSKPPPPSVPPPSAGP